MDVENQHQEGNREINELHLPVSRAVKLTLASEDVIHSFYVPAFRIKQDVVPGRFTTEWFQPTRVGAYRFYCSEYCGADHSKMQGTVFVMSPADYENWLARGVPKNSLAQSGENLFRQLVAAAVTSIIQKFIHRRSRVLSKTCAVERWYIRPRG